MGTYVYSMNRSLFINWSYKKNKNSLKKNTFIVNFGPQHPAAHGVLRLILQLEGEIINRTDTHIGLLHRGTEKLIEDRHYEKSIPYFDRLDYVSMMTQEHAYCLAIEYLQGKKVIDHNISFVRILFDELTRLLNHFLAIACHALDVGSMSSIFWAFEEREKLMEFYERVSGARMHAAFHRPSQTFNLSLDSKLLEDILHFIKNCYTTLNEMHNMLTYNKIWKQRLVNIGSYGVDACKNYGLTGVLARCVGLKRDVRLNYKESYSNYDLLHFKSFISYNGDSYDRFLIRMFEMSESLYISNQCIDSLETAYKNNYLDMHNLNNDVLTNKNADSKVTNKMSSYIINKTLEDKKNNMYTYMEDLIEHFVSWHTGIRINSNFVNVGIESPKGEFGVTLVSNNTAKPYRCKIRSPSYHNLQFLPKLAKGHYLGDLAALIGTIDIVFGEIDR